MNFNQLFHRAEATLVANSPALLTAIGVTGTITTALLTGRASIRAYQILEDLDDGHYKDSTDIDRREMLKLVWTEFIPPVISGGLTIGAIVCAHRVGSRRAAAVASAFAVTEKAYAEYKDKVYETLGEGKEKKIRDSIAQDQIDRVVGNREIIITGDQSMFLDSYSGRTFLASYQEVLAAQNYINYELLNNMHASLSDFYDRLGLDHTANSDNIGWNCDVQLDLEISAGTTKDMKPCLVINFRKHPFPGFHKLH